jgi:hypothetical protein
MRALPTQTTLGIDILINSIIVIITLDAFVSIIIGCFIINLLRKR